MVEVEKEGMETEKGVTEETTDTMIKEVLDSKETTIDPVEDMLKDTEMIEKLMSEVLKDHLMIPIHQEKTPTAISIQLMMMI